MASTYTPLGVELMATGENAGTWGTKTNTNLSIIEQISGGYLEVSIAGGAGTTALTESDGATGSAVATRIFSPKLRELHLYKTYFLLRQHQNNLHYLFY